MHACCLATPSLVRVFIFLKKRQKNDRIINIDSILWSVKDIKEAVKHCYINTFIHIEILLMTAT